MTRYTVHENHCGWFVRDKMIPLCKRDKYGYPCKLANATTQYYASKPIAEAVAEWLNERDAEYPAKESLSDPTRRPDVRWYVYK